MLKLADWTLRFHNPECILDIFIRKLTVLKIILHKNKEKKKTKIVDYKYDYKLYLQSNFFSCIKDQR